MSDWGIFEAESAALESGAWRNGAMRRYFSTLIDESFASWAV